MNDVLHYAALFFWEYMGLSRFLSGLLFGTNTNRIDTTRYTFTKEQITGLVSQTKVSTLSAQEAAAIEQCLIEGRSSHNELSLADIDKLLRSLMNDKKISKQDYYKVRQLFAVEIAKKAYHS